MENIAIPSAHRADRRARSLEQLEHLEGRINVTFFVPEEQAAAYRRWLPGWMWVRAVPACPTVDVARNAIHVEYAGSRVVVMEDDVPWYVGSRAVWDSRLHPGSPPSSPRLNVLEVAALGWAAAEKHGSLMWGIYPVSYSGLALKPRYGVGALFCVGHTVGLDLRSGWEPRLSLPIKEDYELSALAVEADAGVVRLDAVSAYSVSGRGDGGTRVYRAAPMELQAAQDLMRRWPDLFAMKPGLRDGLPQVKMVGEVSWWPIAAESGWLPYDKGAR